MRLNERVDVPVSHELLPIPSGPLTLTIQQTKSLISEFSCNICFEMPAAGEFLETPCCSRVAHRQCVVQSTASTSKGDNKDKKHR